MRIFKMPFISVVLWEFNNVQHAYCFQASNAAQRSAKINHKGTTLVRFEALDALSDDVVAKFIGIEAS